MGNSSRSLTIAIEAVVLKKMADIHPVPATGKNNLIILLLINITVYFLF